MDPEFYFERTNALSLAEVLIELRSSLDSNLVDKSESAIRDDQLVEDVIVPTRSSGAADDLIVTLTPPRATSKFIGLGNTPVNSFGVNVIFQLITNEPSPVSGLDGELARNVMDGYDKESLDPITPADLSVFDFGLQVGVCSSQYYTSTTDSSSSSDDELSIPDKQSPNIGLSQTDIQIRFPDEAGEDETPTLSRYHADWVESAGNAKGYIDWTAATTTSLENPSRSNVFFSDGFDLFDIRDQQVTQIQEYNTYSYFPTLPSDGFAPTGFRRWGIFAFDYESEEFEYPEPEPNVIFETPFSHPINFYLAISKGTLACVIHKVGDNSSSSWFVTKYMSPFEASATSTLNPTDAFVVYQIQDIVNQRLTNSQTNFQGDDMTSATDVSEKGYGKSTLMNQSIITRKTESGERVFTSIDSLSSSHEVYNETAQLLKFSNAAEVPEGFEFVDENSVKFKCVGCLLDPANPNSGRRVAIAYDNYTRPPIKSDIKNY